MVCKIAVAAILYFGSFTPWVHNFYVSITYLKVEGQTLKVTHRIFKDDLELAIRQFTNKSEIDLDTTHKEEVVAYLWEVTAIAINEDRAATNFDSFTIEGSGPTCTVECKFTIDLPKSTRCDLTFESKLLLEQYDEQINMVHFISSQGRTSKNLDAKITSFQFQGIN